MILDNLDGWGEEYEQVWKIVLNGLFWIIFLIG